MCPDESNGGLSESNANTKNIYKNQQSQNELIEKREWAENYGGNTKMKSTKFLAIKRKRGGGTGSNYNGALGAQTMKRGGEGVTLSAVSTGHNGTNPHSAHLKNGSF